MKALWYPLPITTFAHQKEYYAKKNNEKIDEKITQSSRND